MNVFDEFALTLVLSLILAFLAFWLARRFALARPISPRTADSIFLAMAIAYALVFGSLSILRHQSLHSGGFDLGIFDQIVWNSLHGRLFENSISIDAPISLSQRFSPILLALVPLYALWSDPVVLLIVQTLALALSAFPLYWFARERLGTGLALVVAATYFLFPSLQFVNLWDFHEIALATPLLAFTLYFLLQQQHRAFILCLLLALLVREEIAFAAIAFGLYILIVQHRPAVGIGLTAFGAVWGAVILLYVIPFFGNATYGANYQYAIRYQYLGKTPLEIAATAVTQPGLVLQHLLVPPKIEFVLQLLVPLAFVPLVGLEVFALTLPELGYLLLADHPFQNSIRFQYTAPILPFVFFAVVLGMERLTRWRIGMRRTRPITLAVLIGAASIANYYFQSPGPLALQFDPAKYIATAHTALAYQLMQRIPVDASVLADAGLVPHLSHRSNIYEASIEYPPDLRKIEYVFADLRLPVHTDFPVIWNDILASPYFDTVLEQDGYLIKKRTIPKITHPLQVQFDNRITLLGYTVESNEPARRGENARLILTWRADQTIRDRYVAFVHLVDTQGHIWAQDDHEPANGWLRTDRWNAGDITPDRFTLELPVDLPPGDYQMTAGFYTTTDQKNLTARDGAGQELGDAPVIGVLRVIEGTQ